MHVANTKCEKKLCILIAHDFRATGARKWARARTQRRDFPQAKLDSEIIFLLNKHREVPFLLHQISL